LIAIIGLLVSLVLTIVVEVGIAALLGWRMRAELLAVVLVNVLTNPVLNVALDFAYRASPAAYWPALAAGEIAVVLVEWRLLMALTERESGETLRMAIAINVVSLLVGFLLLWVA